MHHLQSLLFAASLSLLAGCATTPTIVPPPVAKMPLPADMKVWIIEPKISREDTASGSPAFEPASQPLAADLAARAAAALRARGCTVVNGPEASPDLASSASAMAGQSDQLLRRFIPAEATALLRSFAAEHPGEVLLVQSMKIKTGPRGSWDPMSGAITSAMNSTLMRAAIVDPRTAQELWSNEVYLRALPDPNNKDYQSAAAFLYPPATP